MDSQTLLDRLVALESDVTYLEQPAGGGPPFRHQPGRLPVLISAPHGAAHHRNGRTKQEDEYTAAFARLLGERTHAHVLYAFARSDDDPNYDRHSPYKTALADLVAAHDIRFVIDLHGMSDRYKFGIAVGTMCGASCRQRHRSMILASLAAAGFRQATAAEARDFPSLRWDRFVVDHRRFTGGVVNHTVTRFAAEELGVHAAQFELSAALRIVRALGNSTRDDDYRGDPAGISQAVLAFEGMVTGLIQLPPGAKDARAE